MPDQHNVACITLRCIMRLCITDYEQDIVRTPVPERTAYDLRFSLHRDQLICRELMLYTDDHITLPGQEITDTPIGEITARIIGAITMIKDNELRTDNAWHRSENGYGNRSGTCFVE
ncbi:hypothetical protein D3C72_1704470 [compost metagenome]